MLDKLPDDVLFIIVSLLEAACSVRALLLTNKHIHKVLVANDQQAWRFFVNSRFPGITNGSLDLPPSQWPVLADSLTWQTRAWARRALTFTSMMAPPPYRADHMSLASSIAARLDLTTGRKKEALFVAAGKELVARWRVGEVGSAVPTSTSWQRLKSSELGFRKQRDIIEVLELVEDVCGRAGELGVLVGGVAGDLALFSAEEGSLGKRLVGYSPVPKGALFSLDLSPKRDVVAAANGHGVLLYSLPKDDAGSENVAPNTYFDVSSQGIDTKAVPVDNAKWMDSKTLVLGLHDEPRFTTLTPTGFRDLSVIRSPNLDKLFRLDSEKDRLISSSLTPLDPVGTSSSSNLLLAAWRDGSIRLQDLRTPSPVDLVYCDNIDPYNEFRALLPHGPSHFIAGNNLGPSINIFDLRWPQRYYHTTALPCSPAAPRPAPHQPFVLEPICSGRNGCCRWHLLSREQYFRPDAKLFFSHALPHHIRYRHSSKGVYSLARASSLAPNFYMGLPTGVVEARLAAAGGTELDPHFGFADTHMRPDDMAGSGWAKTTGDALLMEVGDGQLCLHNHASVRLPSMRGGAFSWDRAGMAPKEVSRRHRLDERWHVEGDYVRARHDGHIGGTTWQLPEGRWLD